MYTYITNGTYYFLKKIEEKHNSEDIILLQNAEGCRLWHETDGPTIFQSPRKYEVIHEKGSLAKSGFVSCNNIPVREEGRPVFEYNFTAGMNGIETAPGFIALRVLRPLSGDTYIVMSMWNDRAAFHEWKNSPAFTAAHEKSNMIKATESTSVFSGPSYMSTYIVSEKEED